VETTGVETGTAQYGLSASVRSRFGNGLTSLITSVSPWAEMPEMCAVSPEWYAFVPTTISGPMLEPGKSFGERTRSISCRNVSAVTGSFEGGEKR
jgi:hypothetical protein